MKIPSIRLSFTTKLTGMLLVISVFPLLLFQFISHDATRRAVIDDAMRHSAQHLVQHRDYLDLQMEQISDLVNNLSSIDKIREVVERSDANSQPSYDTLSTNAQIGYVLSGFSNLRGLVSIDVFSLDGRQFHVGDTLNVSEVRDEVRGRLLRSTVSSPDEIVWHGVEDNINVASNSRKVIVASKAISHWQPAGAVVAGVVVVNFSTDYLHEYFSKLDMGTGAYIMIIDAQQRLIFHPERSLIGQTIDRGLAQLLRRESGAILVKMDGQEVLLNYLQIPDKGWHILSIVPKKNLLATLDKIEGVAIGLMIFILLLIAILIRGYFSRVVLPIRSISDAFNKFESGQLSPQWRLSFQGKIVEEIRELVEWFNKFLDTTESNSQAQSSLRIAATAFEAQEGMTVTDANGTILRVNQAFSRITGYSSDEVIGKNPRILKSGRQNKDFYNKMWQQISNNGSWEGEIWNRRKSGEIYPEFMTITAVKDASGKVTNYVGTFNDTTLSKAATEEIKNLAFYDPLTKLPNRRLLLDRLNKTLATIKRSGTGGALLFLDLDHFKNLNDTLGHDIGDLLLQQVAERLTASVREGDTVARLGGDEFVVMLEDLSSKDVEAAAQAEATALKIMAALNRPYQLETHQYNNSPSIGIALINQHELGREDLLKQADIAMYQSKKAGRNTISFFDPEMQRGISARVALEADMWAALEQDQFVLFYQIQVSQTGHALGAEALIRWQHPERGWIMPAEFIPAAEEAGLILAIGSWVLESACEQLHAWQQNALTRELKLSVNVSAKQFHQTQFVSQVREAVKRHSIDPTLLKLELTESLLLVDIEDTISKMAELKDLGIQFSLDDFGTGFSSLQYLKRLPIYLLKIDQSFVRDIATDPNDRTIVQTIIAMAEKLNLDVIAEGVETLEQRDILLKNGCTNYQGYLFGRPVSIDQFEVELKRS